MTAWSRLKGLLGFDILARFSQTNVGAVQKTVYLANSEQVMISFRAPGAAQYYQGYPTAPKPTQIHTKSNEGFIFEEAQDQRLDQNGKPLPRNSHDGSYGYIDQEKIREFEPISKGVYKNENGLHIKPNVSKTYIDKTGNKQACTHSYIQQAVSLEYIILKTFGENNIYDPQSFTFDENTKVLSYKYKPGYRSDGVDPIFSITLENGIEPTQNAKKEFPNQYNVEPYPSEIADVFQGIDLESLRHQSFGVYKDDKPRYVQCDSRGLAISLDHDQLHSALPNNLPDIAYREYNTFKFDPLNNFVSDVIKLNDYLSKLPDSDPNKQLLHIDTKDLQQALKPDWFSAQGQMTVGIYLRNCKINMQMKAAGAVLDPCLMHGPEVFNPGSPEKIENIVIFYKGKETYIQNEKEYIDFVMQNTEILRTQIIDVHPSYLKSSEYKGSWKDIIETQIDAGSANKLRAASVQTYLEIYPIKTIKDVQSRFPAIRINIFQKILAVFMGEKYILKNILKIQDQKFPKNSPVENLRKGSHASVNGYGGGEGPSDLPALTIASAPQRRPHKTSPKSSAHPISSLPGLGLGVDAAAKTKNTRKSDSPEGPQP